MKRVAGVRGLVVALVALLIASAGSTARAQGGAVISGRVTNEQGAPLANANVFITALGIGAYTSATGTYTVVVPAVRVTGQAATLSARAIGFSRQNRQITLNVGSQSQDFALKSDPFKLDEVIVTGVANATSSAVVPFSVARVSQEQF